MAFIYGTEGSNTFWANNDESDFIFTRGGDDRIYTLGRSSNWIDGGEGTDQVKYILGYNQPGRIDVKITDGGYHGSTTVTGKLNGQDWFTDGLVRIETIIISGNDERTVLDARGLGSASVDFSGRGGNDSLLGSDGNDHLHGNDGNDWLYGQGGNDHLHGGNDYDWLYGGDGNDRLYGGDGHDRLYGGDGVDVLRGEDGNDTLYGDGNNDDLLGGKGNDVLRGGSGGDWISGGADNDTLYGETGNDTLVGMDGNDLLYGGVGSDYLVGTGFDYAGRGEIDKLHSQSWGDTDTFVLGERNNRGTRRVFYASQGNDDYAVIEDFDVHDFRGDVADLIQLATYGSGSAHYSLRDTYVDGISGAGVYIFSELIGIVKGVNANQLNLNDSNHFKFV